MDFNERVLRCEFQMNDTDDAIADYVKTHRAEIMRLSVRKVADELYVAPNTVMRFAKKLGYSGFSELKFALQNETEPQEGNRTIGGQLLNQLPVNIVKTLDSIDAGAIQAVAGRMHRARCCIFAGVGDSSYFCEILGKNLRCHDCSVQYYQQVHDMFYAVRHGAKEDLLIVISARGENARLLELAGEARRIGMLVVSITHLNDNRLARFADASLYFWGEDREVNGYNVTDRSGLMMLVRLLSEEFWQRCGAR